MRQAIKDVLPMQTRTPIFCALCRSRCGSTAVVEDGRLIAQEPNPDHPTGKALCIKGRAAPEIVHNAQRLLHPLIRTSPKTDAPQWREASWDEALDLIARRIGTTRDGHGAEAVAFGVTSPSGSPVSDGIKWIERLVHAFGSPNLLRGTEICNWHKDFSHAYTFGHGIATPEFSNSRAIVLWGHNPGATWLDHATSVAEANARGAALVVIDPRQAGFAGRAREWLQVKPGSDGALALGLAGAMIENGWFDERFVRDWTNGPLLVRDDTKRFLRAGDIGLAPETHLVAWDSERATSLLFDPTRGVYEEPQCEPALRADATFVIAGQTVRCQTAFSLYAEVCARLSPEEVEHETGISHEQITRTARLIYENLPVSYYCWSGISQHANATQTDRAIAMLFALTGSVDAPGGNVQLTHHAVFDVSGFELMSAEQRRKCVEFGRRPLGPASRGWIGSDSLYRAILEEDPYPVKALLCFGANVILSHADPLRARQALQKLDFFVHADVVMTPTAAFADVVLPVNTPWEREALRTGFEVNQGAEELIQLRQKVVEPTGESRSDAWIVFELAKRLGLADQFWGGDLEAGLAAIVAPLGLSLDDLRASPGGLRQPLTMRYRKYAEGGATPKGFKTPTRKIELYSETFLDHGYAPLPVYAPQQQLKRQRRYPLVLTSAKLAQYCHSQHRHVPSLRRRMREPLIEMHPSAASARGIADGDLVRVKTRAGEIQMRAKLETRLKPDVVVGQYGWWQSNSELNIAGYAPFDRDGSNYNLLIDEQDLDAIAGSAPHRAFPCEIERVV
ncbi:molybdopterin-dependent oxidoreductase [Methylocella sp. CPCC 101449]|uniref:molybdopterin-containing oxidoreductase family protein n=1 Tax=Methylocella sp. CPCC 101449 TaxID=2987531 RepID=UPI00288F34F5|nr:molybdopterin-dependent oxidoreductase [Methylocella sp. CPCC 101449]MDT2020186.1 molybdopterin-dependent oxidoreductase [Methylocella sp. CPCC 101449]